VLDNVVQCAYHGLCFDASGRCVKIPGQETIPPKARVQSFPVVERDALVWIWMGDPAVADESRIVRFPRHVDSTWNWRSDRFEYKANHILLYDNLLDLTHVGYVHPNTIGGNEDEHSSASMEIERGEQWIQGTRWMRNSKPPPAYQALKPFSGLIDRWQVMRFDPGLVRISIGAKDAGTAQDANDFEDAYQSHGFHGVTPETESSCHYFWSVGIPSSFDRPGLIERKYDLARETFEEDRQILESQFARTAESPDRTFIDLRADALGLGARRIWTALSALEAQSATSSV